MFRETRRLLLVGASALAILAGAAEAGATTFGPTGSEVTYTVPVSGLYAIDAVGANGGLGKFGGGGLGAEVMGDIFLSAGEDLSVLVGGQGFGGGESGGSGGGGSFIFGPLGLLAAAGGGGGTNGLGGGSPGLAGPNGGAGGGSYGGAGGMSGNGGGGGTSPLSNQFGYNNGGGGAGVNSSGGDGFGVGSGPGGVFGGGGGGGGGSYSSGGGGGGYSGGGGGGSFLYEGGGGGGGGGGSFLASGISNPALIAGGYCAGDLSGDCSVLGAGSVTIDLTRGVPEPSTWAMMLAGFTGLGALALRRKRKVTPA